MAQFDVYFQAGAPGFWLDCQTDWLNDIATRFVIPLIPLASAPPLIGRLNPVFNIGGDPFVLFTQQAGPIPVGELRKPEGSLADKRYEILNALDFLLSGV